jgi:hypothetical protein
VVKRPFDVVVKRSFGQGDHESLSISEIGLLQCISYDQSMIIRGRSVMAKSAKRLASAGLLEENPTCIGEYRRTEAGEALLSYVQRQFR